MPITDLYLVQYLLDATCGLSEPLQWSADEAGAYLALVHGVRLMLGHSHTIGWTGLYLSLTRGEEVVYVEEPRFQGLFGRKYRDEDDRRLAESIRALASAVTEQCRARRLKAWTQRDSNRQSIYQLVVFGGL
jgi:hypothetical protein